MSQRVSRCSWRAQVIQSLSTEINLTILPPDDDEEAEAKEYPIPSQFVTKFVGGVWATEPNEHQE
jgi:hypothetical protein